MSDYFDRLEVQLLNAVVRNALPGRGRGARSFSRGVARWAQRLRRRRPRTLIAVAAVLVVSGSAVAATVWSPTLGIHAPGELNPTTTTSPPPAEQLALLAVLRRPQDAQDRSQTAQDLLHFVGYGTVGVRVPYVRLLTAANGHTALLLSRESDNSPNPEHNALCLIVSFQQGSGSSSCGDTEGLRSNGINMEVSGQSIAVVPDGVAEVVMHYPDGQTLSAPVQDNLYWITGAPADPASPYSVQWLNSNGQTIGPPLAPALPTGGTGSTAGTGASGTTP